MADISYPAASIWITFTTLWNSGNREDAESTTVGGLVTEWLGRVPKLVKRLNATACGSKCWLPTSCGWIRYAFRRRSRQTAMANKKKLVSGFVSHHRTAERRQVDTC